MKKSTFVFSFLVASLFVGGNVAASNNANLELANPGQIFNITLGNDSIIYREIQQNDEGKNVCAKAACCCCLLVASAIFAGVYAPHTYYFYNKGTDSINVHVGQSWVNAYDDDFMMVVKPGKRAVFYSIGKIYHGGSAYTYHGTDRKYVTDKDLAHHYSFDIHENLNWSKHEKSRRLNAENNLYLRGSYKASDFLQQYEAGKVESKGSWLAETDGHIRP